MVTFTARSAALAGVIGAGMLCGALTCGPAQAQSDYYAFGGTFSAGYAILELDVTNGTTSTWVELNTNGVQGWVSPTQFGTPGAYGTNTSYTVGFYNGDYFNNYFGFNLAGTVCDVSAPSDCYKLPTTDTVTAANLVVYSGQISNNLTYTLYGATSLLSQMEAGSPNPNLYDEMMSGPVYGGPFQLPANPTDTVAQLIFALNSAAVTALGTAVQQQAMFAVAGYVDPPSVPEPSTWVMMLAGFAGLGAVARRRAAKRRAAAASG
jgi:hypothetical protein